MALPMPLPAWIQTRPVDFVEAAQGGLNAGIAAARTWQAGLEESARLGQQQRLADLAAKVKEEDSQRNFILDQQKDMAQQEYQRAVIAQRKSEAEQASKEAQVKAQAAMQQYQAMQTLGQARRDAERQRLEIERQRLVNAQNKPKKSGADAADWIAELNRDKTPVVPSGPGLISRAGTAIKDFLTGESSPPADAPTIASQKAARANEVAAQNPDWTKDQVIKAVNDEFSGGSVDNEPRTDEEQ